MIDESPIKVQDPNKKGTCHQRYMWVRPERFLIVPGNEKRTSGKQRNNRPQIMQNRRLSTIVRSYSDIEVNPLKSGLIYGILKV